MNLYSLLGTALSTAVVLWDVRPGGRGACSPMARLAIWHAAASASGSRLVATAAMYAALWSRGWLLPVLLPILLLLREHMAPLLLVEVGVAVVQVALLRSSSALRYLAGQAAGIGLLVEGLTKEAQLASVAVRGTLLAYECENKGTFHIGFPLTEDLSRLSHHHHHHHSALLGLLPPGLL